MGERSDQREPGESQLHQHLPLSHQEQIAVLEREFPRWQVWVVPHVTGPDVWCARLWRDARVMLNACSARELREYLGGQDTAIR